MKDDVEIQYKKTNREKSMEPKRGVFWCGACDAQLVANGRKCPNCHSFNGTRTLKPRAG